MFLLITPTHMDLSIFKAQFDALTPAQQMAEKARLEARFGNGQEAYADLSARQQEAVRLQNLELQNALLIQRNHELASELDDLRAFFLEA